MVKVLIAVVLLAHGLGHSMGLLQLFKVATISPAWRGDSWLLTGSIGAAGTHLVGVVLWSVAIVGFAGLAASVVGWLPEGWFAPLAIAASVASLAGVVLFPIAFPTFSTLGAIAVDIAVLVAATWVRLLPSDIGS